MAPSVLHLLTLPREIRDIIYWYLVEDVNFKYQWSKDAYAPNLDRFAAACGPLGPAISTEVILQIQKNPPSNVLLIHPRLKDEAQEFRTQLAAEILIEVKGSRGRQAHIVSLDGTLVNNAFYNVRHITIVLSCGSDHAPNIGYWKYIQQFVDTLLYKTPYLTTVRVVLRHF